MWKLMTEKRNTIEKVNKTKKDGSSTRSMNQHTFNYTDPTRQRKDPNY